jgi:hypothetical protein
VSESLTVGISSRCAHVYFSCAVLTIRSVGMGECARRRELTASSVLLYNIYLQACMRTFPNARVMFRNFKAEKVVALH